MILGKSQNANIDMLIFRDVRKPPNFHNLRFFEIAIYENHTDDVSNISNHTNRKVEGAFQCCQPDSSWHFLSDGSLHERRRNIERRLPLYDRFRYQKRRFRHNFRHTSVEIGRLHPRLKNQPTTDDRRRRQRRRRRRRPPPRRQRRRQPDDDTVSETDDDDGRPRRRRTTNDDDDDHEDDADNEDDDDNDDVPTTTTPTTPPTTTMNKPTVTT